MLWQLNFKISYEFLPMYKFSMYVIPLSIDYKLEKLSTGIRRIYYDMI